jgi:hypothetical protein
MRTLLRAIVGSLALATALALLASSLAAPQAQQAPERKAEPFAGWFKRIDETHLDFTHYYTLEECEQTIDMFAARFPELLSVETIGQSYQGRPLRVLTMCNAKTGAPDTKPAMYIDSNIHGNEIQGTEIIFIAIWHLLKNYPHEAAIQKLVDTRTFYFLPVVNVDSRYHWFAQGSTPHEMRHNWKPFDDDRDGKLDEDGPNDLDGDKRITMMRKKDPNGDYVLSADKRIMLRKKPGQPGEYRVWFTEGLDDDGDGQINEDSPGGVDMNRNFPTAWLPRYRQFGAGDYPTSEPEIRCIVDFLIAHKNIAGMQFFHNAAKMILRPPGSSPDAGVTPREDIVAFDRIGKPGEKIIPGYSYRETFEGLYPAYGTQIDFGYLGLGRFAFTNELAGGLTLDMNDDGRIDADDEMQWHDLLDHGRAWIDFKPFTHPTLGEIEIGGWDQFATRMPPADLFIEDGYRNALFVLHQASCFAELALDMPRAEDLGGGLYRVRFVLRNTGAQPTDSVMAVQRREDESVRVTSSLPLVSCALADETYKRVTLQKGKQDYLRAGRISGEGEAFCEMLVRGKKGDKLALSATHPRAVKAGADIVLP